MATTLTHPTGWAYERAEANLATTTDAKLSAFFEKQAKFQTAWFLFSLTFQGVFFLPVPAILIDFFHAPVYILTITLGLFFANLIAGMANSGVRTIITLLASSIVIHLAMLAFYTL